MCSPSRRRVLGGFATALVGLSGCSSDSGQETPTDVSTPTPTDRVYEDRLDAPETRQIRNTQGSPAVRTSDHSPLEDTFEESEEWAYEVWLITSEHDSELLEFHSTTTGVEATREFLADSDMFGGAVLVDQYRVDECHTRRLERVEWTEVDGKGHHTYAHVALAYETTEREGQCGGDGEHSDASPPYDAGSYHSEATFVRVPESIPGLGAVRRSVTHSHRE